MCGSDAFTVSAEAKHRDVVMEGTSVDIPPVCWQASLWHTGVTHRVLESFIPLSAGPERDRESWTPLKSPQEETDG